MLEPHDIVDHRRHRLTRCLGVAVREAHGDLLVTAKNQFGMSVTSMVHNGIMKPAESRPRVHGGVLDAEGAHEVHDKIGTELGLE
jgi:hypothetical protein